MSRMFSKGVPRHVSATRASCFVRCRSAQQGKQYALLQTSSNQASQSHVPRLFRMISPFSTQQRRQSAPKSAIFMPQTTEISPKCAPANSTLASKHVSIAARRARYLRAWPEPSRFLVKSLPPVDRGAMLGLISAASPRPRTSINARNNDEWNPTPGS